MEKKTYAQLTQEMDEKYGSIYGSPVPSSSGAATGPEANWNPSEIGGSGAAPAAEGEKQKDMIAFDQMMTTYETKVREAGSFYETWKSKQDSEAFRENFGQTVQSVQDSLKQLKEKYGDDWKVASYLNKVATDVNNIGISLVKSENYWSQWESQEAYTAWDTDRQRKEDQLGLNLDDYARKIEDLRQEQEYYRHNAEFDGTNMENWIAYEDKLDEYDREISRMTQYMNQAKYLQEGRELSSAVENEDFRENSRYQAQEPMTGWEKFVSRLQNGQEVSAYEYINGGEEYRESVQKQVADSPEAARNSSIIGRGLENMTDQEIGIYNYYYNTAGKEKAQQYLDSIQESLNQRQAGHMVEAVGEGAWGKMGFGALAGFDQAMGGMQASKEFVTGRKDYIPVSSLQMASGAVRESLANPGERSWKQAAYDTVTNTANMIPSITASIVANAVLPGSGHIVGNAVMGSSVVGNAYREALNCGWTREQARTYAGLTGASELFLGELLGGISQLSGAENLWKNLVSGVDNAFAHISLEWGANAFGEGLEEFLQDVLDPFFKSWTFDTEREDINWGDAMYSGILGAFSAGLLGLSDVAGDYFSKSKLGKEVRESGVEYAQLQELGKTFDKETVSGRLSGKIGENSSNYTLGRLLNAFGEELTEANRSDIAARLEGMGVRNMDATIIAKGVAAYAEGKNMSLIQKLALDKNQLVTNAVEDVLFNADSTVNQRMGQYAEILNSLNKDSAKEVQAAPEMPVEEATHKDVLKAGTAELDSLSEKYGDHAEVMKQLYNPKEGVDAEYDVASYDRAFAVAYKGGQEGVSLDYVKNSPIAQYMHPTQIEVAYEAGQEAQRRATEVSNGTEEIRLRDSGQRNDGADPGRQVSTVGKTAAGAESRTAPGNPGAVENNFGKVQEVKSARDIGIPGGTSEKNIRFTSGKDTGSMKKARAVAKKYGVEIQFFEGGNLHMMSETGNLFEARAYVDGQTMYVRSDHPNLPAHKLARHEAAHHQVTNGEVDVNGAYDYMVEAYGGERYVQKLIDQYAAAFDGSDMTAEEIFEEILCDSVAEINAFGGDAIAKEFQKNLGKLVESGTVGETGGRGPPVEGKARFSIEEKDGRRYVRSDREILTGEDPEQWKKQLEGYINETIRKGEDVVFPTDDGHFLVLTGRSAYKLSDNHKASILEKMRPLLSDTEYRLKAQVAGHIDELIQVAKFAQYDKDQNGKHENDIGEDGFNYYSAFFRDSNEPDSYYRVRFSAGLNENTETVYSIGSIRKRSTSSNAGSSGKAGAQKDGRSTSNNIIYSSTGKSQAKSAFQIAFEEAQKKSGGKTSREAVGAAKIEQSTNLIQQQLEYWLGKPKKRNGEFARPEDVRRVVRNIVKEYQSTVDKKEITEAMQELADLIIREGDQIIQKGYSTNGLTYDEIRAKAADIAWEILGNSQAIANESDVEFYDEIKSYLRKMPISLTEESDIADFKDFRKRNFGRLLIKKDGLPIDTVWTELQEAFGKGFFPDDITHPADQLMHLEELLNNMEAVYYNPYEVTMPQNVEACANAIVDKLFSEAVQPVSTYMDQELESMSQKIQQNEADIRQLKKEKDQLLKQNELLSKQSDGVNQYREARTKTQMKNQIRNTAKELGKILNSGTKERNVKEGLREVAGSTLRLAQVLFSDMRMETILYGMDTYAMTDKEKWTLDQYIALASKRDKLKERKQKLLKEASESAQAWLDTEGDRNSLDEQYQKIREKMAPLADKLQSVAERERNRLKSQGMVGMAIDEMASAYKSLEGAEEKYIAAAYDGLVHDRMLQLKEDLKDAYIGDMTMKQMRDVYDIMQMMMSTIRNSNKLFAKSTTDTLVETAEKVTHELTPMQKQNRTTTETGKAVSKFHWNNYKPIYAFLRIGSDTMTKLYENIRKGEETWYVDMEEAKQFRLDTEKKHGFKKWDFDKKFGFTSSSGMDFQLSLQDIMSLYACYKREQALDHIMLGGFVFDPNVKQTVKGKLGFKKEIIADNATAYNVDLGTWGEIVGKLTKEQKAFVDEMQEYLYNTMGGKGNEISVAMYGVKLFREQFYFPLRSAPAYNARIQEQQEGSVKIKNSGFTKETVEHASKPIVLTPFMDVWADHINEMSMYHSFTLPLEDFYRVYNFGKNGTEADATSSTVAAIQNAHGQAAVGYIDQLLKDINAGRMADPRESPMKQLTGRFKKAAVLASMSVTIRQASAGPRAMAYVNPKFFRPELMDLFGKRHTAAWEEMKQHAPIVGIKEMGYFDTGLGRSARDYLLAEEYEGFRENFKAFFKDQSYRDELMGKAPGWVDEVTWIGIWKAVKRETKVKHPELKAGSEAFLQTAGERFTDVIQLTQVYDSVFARSGNMRSGSAAMSDITSFMAEPTTTINMAEFAGRDLIKSIKTKDTKTAKKSMGTFGAITTAIVLDSLLGAIVYAARDDDEDKTYGEKYVENVVSGLLSGVNILTYIPLARDVWTLTQGFDVERADMSLIGSFLDAVTAWGKEASRDTTGMTEVQQAEHSRKMAAAAMKVADGLGSLCGEPTRNLRRDALAVRNLFDHNNWKKSSKASVWDAVVSGWKSSMPFSSLIKDESKSDKLYTAILSGDKVYEDRLRGQYKDESAVQSAIRKGLRDNDPRIRRAAEAMYHEDFEAAWKEAKAVQASGFTFDDVNSAIHSEVKELEPKEEKEKEEKHYSLFSPESYAIEALKKNATMLGTIKEEVMKVAQENGKTQAEAEKSFQSSVKKELKDIYLKGETPDQVMVKLLTEYCGMKADDAEAEVSKWSFQEEYDMAWEDMKQAFVDEEISESQAVEFLVAYGGSEREDAQKTVQKWLCKRETKVAYEDIKDAYIHEKISKDQVFEMYLKYGGYEEENAKKRANSYEFIKNNPECDGITDAAVEKYNQYCAASGVDAGIYYQAYKYIGSLENDKDANGKSISFSAMEKGLAYINNLPISSAQKDAIARSRGWKESNINRLKPWK